MTEEIQALTARARQLEEENATLRSMQPPSGDEAALHSENALLRAELEHVRRAHDDVAPARAADAIPRTLDEFLSLPPHERRAAAWQMTRSQRDELLGRGDADRNRQPYL